MTKTVPTLLLMAAACLLPLRAEVFKSAAECAVGKRVTDSSNKSGSITKIDGTMCQVRRDDGTSTWYLFWMLHSQGASAETDDKLIPGRYACYASGNYTFMDIRITSASTYETDGGRGRYHVDPSRKIVFESGPLQRNFAKLTRGPNIDINSDGSSFYGTTCSYQKK